MLPFPLGECQGKGVSERSLQPPKQCKLIQFFTTEHTTFTEKSRRPNCSPISLCALGALRSEIIVPSYLTAHTIAPSPVATSAVTISIVRRLNRQLNCRTHGTIASNKHGKHTAQCGIHAG